MSTDQAVREAQNRYARRVHRLKAYGLWEPFVDAEPARQHMRNLIDYGISAERIADISGLHLAVVNGILYDFERHRRRGKIRPETEAKVLAVEARFEHIHDRHVIDGTATRRRLQALAAVGYPFRRLGGEHLPLHPAQVGSTARATQVMAGTHRAVADTYDRLAHQDPTEHGIRPGTALKIRRYAQAEGWAPPSTWDDDTIADPNAHPEWTGHCGTDHGWWKHKAEAIPTCPRCEAAHAAWLAERRDLPAAERFRQLAQAKSAASNRGANLAHDARELMRVSGLTREQAAARLGVHTTYVDQAMKAHPQTGQELAA